MKLFELSLLFLSCVTSSHILYSWFRASSLYINKIQQDATDAGIYYCKLTLRVSGVYRTHQQEYIKLKLQLLVQVIVSGQRPSASVA